MNSKIKIKYPIAIQWKISETKLQEKRNSVDGYLDSTVFNIPGTDVQFYITVYPNGSHEVRRGESWIFFCLDFEGKKEIEAEFTVSIKTSSYSHERKYVYKESIGSGGGKAVCTTDELFDPAKRFIVDGFMVIKLEGFLMIEMNAPKKLFDLGNNGNILGINLWNQETKDFTVVADGKEITAHKLILSTHSPVFAAMFKPHTSEAQKNKVIITDFPFEIVETAIKLCYDSKLVQKAISIEDQILLYQFFDKYNMQVLKTELEKLMILEVNEFNVCSLTNCIIISNAPNLMEKCAKFLEECIRNQTPITDFDTLDKDFVFKMVKNSLFKLSS